MIRVTMAEKYQESQVEIVVHRHLETEPSFSDYSSISLQIKKNMIEGS